MAPLKPLGNFIFEHFFYFCFHQTFFWLQVYIGNGKCKVLLHGICKHITKWWYIIQVHKRCFFLRPHCVNKHMLLTFDLACLKPKKPRKAQWELNQVFQNVWAIKLPWAKVVMGPIGKMSMVRCKVSTFVEKEKNCLSPNLIACKTMLGDTSPLLQGSSVTRPLFLVIS